MGYAHGDTDGQKGGYLQRCTMPYGYAFVVGQTQSVLCEAEDAPNYTLGPTPALQVNIGSAYGWPCEYCKMEEVDGAYPDVLDWMVNGRQLIAHPIDLPRTRGDLRSFRTVIIVHAGQRKPSRTFAHHYKLSSAHSTWQVVA